MILNVFFLFLVILSVGRIFVAIYGYFHASMVLMKHLIDPAQFVLFWIALLFNQIWNEYFTVRCSFDIAFIAIMIKYEYIDRISVITYELILQLTNRNFVMTDGREWYIFLLLVMSEICRSPLTLIGIYMFL